MTLKALFSQGLDDLCSKEQLQLLNAIDSLRSQGISHYISLPQIIVCGDQSSGKSSVLEAISGVSFPIKSNLCTRFPIELILRKTSFTSINISIVPHHSRNDSDKDSLSNFREELDSFDNLPQLIENAKVAMGIMASGKAFSEDILRIEINGPDRPHLTIVDLPGLIHSENKYQSTADIKLITNVVKSYMKEPRSVMLAVVSAKNDYANQIVLKLVREADPRGTRTLGIITKPDTVIYGSISEKQFISLARNQDIEFRLGWHVLRNRDTDAESCSLKQRDIQELEFFCSGAWGGLPSSDLGIKPLRERLSKLLVRQIASELPNLMNEIKLLSTRSQKQLDKLGQSRITAHEQRIYLIQISQAFQSLIQAAVDGTYTDPYFGDAMSEKGYQKRIRAVVQNLNEDFASKLDRRGQKYRIVSSTTSTKATEGMTLTREQYVDKIIDLIDRDRGRELPGMFNPMIVASLFKEQSFPWKEIAENHVKQIWSSVRLAVRHSITHIADVNTVPLILDELVEPRLRAMLKDLTEKLLGLLKPHQNGHPITYNHNFAETLHKIRLDRQRGRITKIVQDAFGLDSMTNSIFPSSNVQPQRLVDKLVDDTDKDVDHFAASDALDCLDAYYKVAMKRFIDDIAVEVVETCVVGQLNQLITPLSVSMMSDEEIARIASETEQSRVARKELETKLKVLRSGAETCKMFSHGINDKEMDEIEKKINEAVIVDNSEESGEGVVSLSDTEQRVDKGAVTDIDGTKEKSEEDDFWGGVVTKSKKTGKKEKKKLSRAISELQDS